MNDIKIEPCPFCKGVAELKSNRLECVFLDPERCNEHVMKAYVECTQCHARGSLKECISETYDTYEDLKEQAVKSWNKRAGESECD